MARKIRTAAVLIPACVILFLGLFLSFKPLSKKAPTLASSKDCKECHEEIFNHWKNGMHAMTIEDPIFKASYIQSYFNTSGQAKFNCLRCHAPVTLANEDYDLKQEVTNEGVNCDFCHSIKKVDLDRKDNPFVLELGETKWGPLSNVSSPAHKTEPSSLFKSSDLCAGCHQYTNDHGVTILGTYSEWKESPYPGEGIQCQNCHMPLILGNIIKPTIKPPSQKQINLHAISASHSTEQLQKALKVEIKDLTTEKDLIYVVVGVNNHGSGHMVPTGIPGRQLILLVELRTPNEYYVQQRTYQRVLLDTSGKEIKKEGDLFLHAAKVSFDNRLKPRETRIESFVFASPKNKKITITARMEYLYKTTVLSPIEMRVKMSEDIKSISQ